MAAKIKVMIVDDSAVVRQVNRETLEREPDMEVIGAAIDPMATDLKQATKEMSVTLQALHQTIDETHGLLSTDSGIGFGVEGALVNLKEATNALRLLLNTLEQNPDMLLRGKRPPGGKTP